MFFSSWESLLRVVVVGVPAYVVLVLLLRVYGKRTLSKMNAFDFVVTIALGSTLATLLLSKDVALLEGLLAFALLMSAQLVVSLLQTRSETAQDVVKSEPALLFFRGRYLDDRLAGERVTREEVRAAIRSHGISAVEEVEAVVLETDGTFSVVRRGGPGLSAIEPDVGLPH